MAENLSINLVRKRKKNYLDLFFSWALTAGRLIVILTEVVALCAFIFRFSLDSQLIRLNDRITQEQNIVGFLKNNETKYRNLQDRVSLAQKVIAAENYNITTYEAIKNLIPNDLDVQNFTFSLSSIKITATTKSVDTISNFVNRIKAYPTVSSVSIDDIQTQADYSTIQISLTINLNNKLSNNL